MLSKIMNANEYSAIFKAMFYQAPIGIAISYDCEPDSAIDNKFLDINPTFEKITGRTKEELIKLGWAKITHPDDLEEDLKYFRKLQRGEIDSYTIEKRYIKPDGSVVWVHMVVAPLNLTNDNVYNHICLIQDITERKEIEKALTESERSKSVLLSHLPGMAYRCNYDREWTMQFVSDGCFELTGYTPESLLYNKDLSFNDLILPEYRNTLWEKWDFVISQKLPFRDEYEIQTPTGERKWVLEMGQGIYNEQGEVEALEGIIFDISTNKEIERALKYNSEHDIWTGLYNRRYLENLLESDAKISSGEKRAVVSVNLSAIHLLSLTYGFHYSQDLLKNVADALKSHCSPRHQLFNTYEYRFVFYVKAYKDKNELTAFCETVANTVTPLLSAERISGGIGVLEINGKNKRNIELMLKNLLITSEKAANTYGSTMSICFFDEEMEKQVIRDEIINRELAEIIAGQKTDRLYLQYQPILDLKTNQICGFEALARLNSEQYGRIPPLEFIAIAEKEKTIIPLGEMIIGKALAFLKKLNDSGYDNINISINISVIQLRKDFAQKMIDRVEEIGVNPANICIEITESVFASNFQEINHILVRLKDYGIKIAIDDFGTGYSSLSRERELNINCLKIEKSFIDKLTTLDHEHAITGDIVSMAHKLGHYVIAEGIEHEIQREYLEKCGCDKIQGYLIGKPLDWEAAAEMLKSKSH